jgi:cytochrome P450
MFGEGLIATVGAKHHSMDSRKVSDSMVLGERHRMQRKLLNPVFSTSNMRELLPTLQPIARKLTSILVAKLPDDGCK